VAHGNDFEHSDPPRIFARAEAKLGAWNAQYTTDQQQLGEPKDIGSAPI